MTAAIIDTSVHFKIQIPHSESPVSPRLPLAHRSSRNGFAPVAGHRTRLAEREEREEGQHSG